MVHAEVAGERFPDVGDLLVMALLQDALHRERQQKAVAVRGSKVVDEAAALWCCDDRVQPGGGPPPPHRVEHLRLETLLHERCEKA